MNIHSKHIQINKRFLKFVFNSSGWMNPLTSQTDGIEAWNGSNWSLKSIEFKSNIDRIEASNR